MKYHHNRTLYAASQIRDKVFASCPQVRYISDSAPCDSDSEARGPPTAKVFILFEIQFGYLPRCRILDNG